MQVAFTKEDVVDPLKLHGSTILWLEEHRILNFDTSDVGADRDDCRPRQAAASLRGTEPSNRGRVSGTDEAVLVSS